MNTDQFKQSTVEEVKIPVPWGHVAGRWWGPKHKQPILLIHGWLDNAGTWDNLIPLLPSSMSYLCIDLPGMGLSSPHPKGMLYYKIWDGIVLVRRIVRHYKWKRVNLMGHSFGAAVALMYSGTYPDEVDSLACVEIATPSDRTMVDYVKSVGLCVDTILRNEEMNPSKTVLESYDDIIDSVHQSYKGSVSRENCIVMMKRGIAHESTKTSKGYYLTRDPNVKFSLLGIVFQEESFQLGSRIKCKSLNIKAISTEKKEDNAFTMLLMEKIREKVELTHVEVEGTHHVHLECPEKIAGHIAEFYEEFLC